MWLVEEQGGKTVSMFSRELWTRIRDFFNQQNGLNYPTFLPWMSRSDWYAQVKPLFAYPLKDITVEPGFLKDIHTAYSPSGAPPLSALTDGEDRGVDTLTEDSSSLHEAFQIFSSAKERILNRAPVFLERFQALNQTLVPLSRTGPEVSCRIAFTSHDVKGAMFLVVPDTNQPNWALDLEVDIIHELGHMALIVYQSVDPLIDSSWEEKVYSGVRKTDRPVLMSLHAAAALTYMLEYLLVITGSCESEIKEKGEWFFAQRLIQQYGFELFHTLAALKSCRFTELGSWIFDEFNYIAAKTRGH